MNRYSLVFGLLVLPTSISAAGQHNCRPMVCTPMLSGCSSACETQVTTSTACAPSSCGTLTSSSYGPTTKYFKAKDGTIREVMTHWAALHRAVEADHMEEELVATKTELEAAKTQLADLQKQSETQIAAMEEQLAALKAQLGQQSAVAETEKERANKAEEASRKGQKQIVTLKERSKTAEAKLAELEKQMQQTVADRDALRTANDKLQQEVASLKDTVSKSAAALAESQSTLEKMKQDAIESKKTEIATNETKHEEDPNAGNDKPTEEKPAEEPAEEPKQEDADK